MKTILVVPAAFALGGLAFWGVQRMGGKNGAPEGAPVGSEVTVPADGGEPSAPAAPPPKPPGEPILWAGSAEEAGAVASEPPPAPPAPPPQPATFRDPAPGGAAGGPTVRPAAEPAVDEDRRLALATFDGGDRQRGRLLLEGVFGARKDRPDLDLSPEVERLYEDESRYARRLEYAEYLARRGKSERPFALEIERAGRHLAGIEEEPDRAVPAWEALSLAYELAAEPSTRRQALGLLEPFLERLVFAGRHSPLLKSATVATGDNLSKIAAKYSTTVDALRRLNNLQAEVIQPGQRLRVLPGKVTVHVDKSDFRLWLRVDGRVLLERRVGLGKDNGTPVGVFAVAVRQKDPSWFRPGEPAIPAGDPRNVLGTRWLGFKATEELSGYGIHGTDDLGSIGAESSAGCVRLRNEDIEVVYDFIPLGTQVAIRP